MSEVGGEGGGDDDDDDDLNNPQGGPPVFPDEIFVHVMSYMDIYDITAMKSVCKNFNENICKEAILNKSKKPVEEINDDGKKVIIMKDNRKKFETKSELRDAVCKLYAIKYDDPDPLYILKSRFGVYKDGFIGPRDLPSRRKRRDAEFIATTYGWIINSWLVGNVTDFSNVFWGLYLFNEDISGWDTSNATMMKCMFDGAYSFNQDLSRWITSNVTNMYGMFYFATSFNQPIGHWNTSNVTSTSEMFRGARSFDQIIGGWNMSNVRGIFNMFKGASSFNDPTISNWDISNASFTRGMFHEASSFNPRQLPWFDEDMLDH